jgi:hypothetical protein
VRAVVDRKVTARFRDGDPEAVRAVYRSVGHVPSTVTYTIRDNQWLTEEATQKTFLNARGAAADVNRNRELGRYRLVGADWSAGGAGTSEIGTVVPRRRAVSSGLEDVDGLVLDVVGDCAGRPAAGHVRARRAGAARRRNGSGLR